MASNPFGPAWRWAPRPGRTACPGGGAGSALGPRGGGGAGEEGGGGGGGGGGRGPAKGGGGGRGGPAPAPRADIVLPATTSIERNDIAGNRRSSHLIAMQKAIEPLGQARSDYDIFRAIAQRLGGEAAFSEGRDEMDWLRHLYEVTREDVARRFQQQMPDFDTFWAEGAAEVPTRPHFTCLQSFRADPGAHPLNTESGRIVLWSQALEALGFDDCPPHPAWIEPAEWLGAAGAGERNALHLISRQPESKLHSQLDDAPASMAAKRHGREQVRIHPRDAALRGIVDGATVRLWNARGQCLASAWLTDTVRPG